MLRQTGEFPSRARRALPVLLILYGVASLGHFVHNAEFLADYPNLPAWLTRGQVYVAWLGIQAVGVVGYLLARAKYEFLGFGILGVYAAIGLDGLLHYSRAPMAAHTAAMNLTIWFEVAAAVLVLCAIAGLLGERFRASQRDA
jgi:hypothetical protein